MAYRLVGEIKRFGMRNLPVVNLPYLSCQAEKATYCILFMAHWYWVLKKPAQNRSSSLQAMIFVSLGRHQKQGQGDPAPMRI